MTIEIVGITEDTKYAFPNDRPDPIFFLPLSQSEGPYKDSAQASEQRMTHYIGSIQLRVAGADRLNVVKMVFTGAMKLIGLGLTIGIPAALLGGKAIASQLFGVRPYDPMILSGAVLTLLACALIAALLPARRAASIDHLIALRSE